MQIEEAVVGRCGIDFEVAGVHDHSDRGVDGEGDAIDQAVGYLDGMNRKRACFEALVRANLAQVGVIEQAVLVEFVFDIGQREFGGIHRNVQLGKNPGESADVVFVAVGEDDSADTLPVLDEIGNVGYYDVNAEKFGLGEHETGVDDNNVIAPAHGH